MPRLNLTEAETRNLILDEADRLFTEIGYDKTTVADIARACGFSSSNVHRVFGTKGHINRAIAKRKLQGKIEAARAAAEAEESAAKRLGAFYATIHRNTYDMFIDNSRIHQMVAAAIEERWEEVVHYRCALMESGKAIIRYGVERGEFQVDDVDAASRALHASGMRYCHPLAVAEMDDAPDDVPFDVWLNYTLRALGADRPL